MTGMFAPLIESLSDELANGLGNLGVHTIEVECDEDLGHADVELYFDEWPSDELRDQVHDQLHPVFHRHLGEIPWDYTFEVRHIPEDSRGVQVHNVAA